MLWPNCLIKQAGKNPWINSLACLTPGFRINRLIYIRQEWESKAVNDLMDDYAQGQIFFLTF
jgi:hypothetical protein